jgi:hypothetical protein
MTRDPSDGSVRGKPVVEMLSGTTIAATVTSGTVTLPVDEKPFQMSTRNELPSDDKPLMSSTTSGLQTGSTKPENLARLEKSRKFIRDYRVGKINSGWR